MYNSNQENSYSTSYEGIYSSSSYSREGWNSLSVKRTSSFTSIQDETFTDVISTPTATYTPYNPSDLGIRTRYNSREEETPDGSSTGQLNPGSPMGDMLLPLLAMAAAYIIVKLFRNRKTSQAL